MAKKPCFFISGCQTASVFNLKTFNTNADDLHVIFVNSDRVQQKCLFFDAEAENNLATATVVPYRCINRLISALVRVLGSG